MPISIDTLHKKLTLLENMDDFEGYWVSPSNQVIKLKGKGANDHVSAILKNPVKFGFTKEEISSKMGKNNKISSKGKEYLVAGAVNRGWVRIRRYSSYTGYTWKINVKVINDRVRTILNDFFTEYAENHGTNIGGDFPSLGDDVYIDSVVGGDREHYTANDIIRFKMWKDSFSESKIRQLRRKYRLIRD